MDGVSDQEADEGKSRKTKAVFDEGGVKITHNFTRAASNELMKLQLGKGEQDKERWSTTRWWRGVGGFVFRVSFGEKKSQALGFCARADTYTHVRISAWKAFLWKLLKESN